MGIFLDYLVYLYCGVAVAILNLINNIKIRILKKKKSEIIVQEILSTYPQINNFTAIVTGSSSGIGLHTACKLSQVGYHVILGCRNEQKGLNAVEYIKEECTKIGKRANVEYVHLDLSSFESIDKFVNTLQKRNLKINLLINNAGIMFAKYSKTIDGFESHFGVNYLGHFRLTLKLLPNLIKNGPSRIVNLTSETHKWGKLDMEYIRGEKYHRWWSYCNSKLALIYFSNSLHNTLREQCINNISVFAVNPGCVCTDIIRSTAKIIIWIYTSRLMKFLLGLREPKDGSSSVVFCALDEDVVKYSGEYIDYTCEYTCRSMNATDEKIGKELLKASEEIVGLKIQDIIKTI